MTPDQLALLADARRLLRTLAPLCTHAPIEKRAGHLAAECEALAGRIERHIAREAH